MSPAPAEVAVLDTSEGQITLEFWPDVAPKTVENFKTLARKVLSPRSPVIMAVMPLSLIH